MSSEVSSIVANTSQKHKEKKSQKRKDRQLRRKRRAETRAREKSKSSSSFMSESVKAMKGTSKSLPGFLAKNSSLICRWLNDYCILFQEADDAYIDYLKLMDREKRNQLVQDYVDIRVFLRAVEDLHSKQQSSEHASRSEPSQETQDEEVLQEAVGEVCDPVWEHQSVQVPDVHSI